MSSFANASGEPLFPTNEKPVPHIALLLPLNSPDLGAAAEAIYQGVLAAQSVQSPGFPIKLYSNFDSTHSVIDSYLNAIANGAVAVVGPLTRNSIRQLASAAYIPIPTLALNVIDNDTLSQLYFFGMNVEAEAAQVAILARKQGLKQAIVITSPGQLALRLQFAFENQWAATGGVIVQEIDFNGDTSVFKNIEAAPDTMTFFATDVKNAWKIRPYLPNNLAIYATSQVFSGNNDPIVNFDLNEVHFVDMPWLLQPDHPAVMIYPRPSPPLAVDKERLYALGIDAYRLIQVLLADQLPTALPLDGVTGGITLNGHTFEREARPAQFIKGYAISKNSSVNRVEPMFPLQATLSTSNAPLATPVQ
ncbi:MAG: penicillin-binding protein activator [Gallionella sp.]